LRGPRAAGHHDDLAVAHRLFVDRHVDQLVHEREGHESPQSSDDAVHGAPDVQPVRALGPAQDRDVPVLDARRAQGRGGRGR